MKTVDLDYRTFYGIDDIGPTLEVFVESDDPFIYIKHKNKGEMVCIISTGDDDKSVIITINQMKNILSIAESIEPYD